MDKLCLLVIVISIAAFELGRVCTQISKIHNITSVYILSRSIEGSVIIHMYPLRGY